MLRSLFHPKPITGKAMLKYMNEQLYSKRILGDSLAKKKKKKSKWCLWPWAIAFWLFDENQAWLMYNVDHKTHVVAEAQLPCVGEHLVDITVIQWANTLKDLGIRCPYTLFLALKSSLFSPSWMGNKGRLALAVDLDKRCLTLNCRLTSCFITTKWGLIRLRDKTVTDSHW